MNDDTESHGHSEENHHHLVALRQTDDLRSARDGIGNDQSTCQPDGEVEPPAEQSRENDGGRIDRDARRQAALHKKKKCA